MSRPEVCVSFITVPLENGEHVPERALDIDQVDSLERNSQRSVDVTDQFVRIAAVKRASSPVGELCDDKAGAQCVLAAKVVSRGDADVRDQVSAVGSSLQRRGIAIFQATYADLALLRVVVDE